MSFSPRISVTPMTGTTRFAPLVVLGFFVREYDLLSPLYSRLEFASTMHTEYPTAALIELGVSILAGCRSVSQINTEIRPDVVLAQAWGRPGFAEQSTVARVLDGCQGEQVGQLREGVDTLYRWMGQAPHHAWARSDLVIDIDLTGLLAGRQAEGSCRGYFSEKKGPMGGNSVASGRRITMKV
jgi:hypothetical protein